MSDLGGASPRRRALAALAALVLASVTARGGPATRPRPLGAAAEASAPAVATPVAAPGPAVVASARGTLRGPDGAGLPAGHIAAWPEGSPLDRRETTTDAAGAFELSGLAEGRWVVAGSADGYSEARCVRALPLADLLDLRVVRAARVAGQILGVDGLPASAEVVIVGSGIWPARSIRAGADGRFAFESVPPGVYEVEARGALASEPRRGLVVAEGARVLLTLALSPGATLAGSVLDAASGAPIQGAEIVVASESLSSTPRTTRSDATGAFRIAGLREGDPERVSVRAPGFVPVVAELWNGGPMTLRLAHAGTLTGVVLDRDRRPVEGAEIEIWGEATGGQPIAVSAASGGLHDLLFRDERSTFGDPGRLDVTTEVPAIPLDALTGTPSVGGAESGSSAAPVALASYRSDVDGHFEIPGIAPGHVQVTARAAGLATTTSDRIYVGPGATDETVELVLPPAGHVIGDVEDERGEPVADALVELRGDQDPSPRVAFTDAYGRFAFEATGSVVVRVLPTDRPTSETRVTVASGQERRVVLTLDPAGLAMAGRVVDARGFPIEGVQLRVEALRPGAPSARTAFTGADGRFDLASVPSPPLRITADHTDFAVGTQTDADTLEDLTITLRPALLARGNVVDAWSGEPIAGARVWLFSDGVPPVVRETISRDDGGFAIPRVGAGTYAFRIESTGHVAYEGRVVARTTRGREVEIEEVALDPGQRVEGDVVDHLGQVAAGTRVDIEGVVPTTTDEQGHFVLETVAAGEAVVIARHAVAGETRTAATVVRGRDLVSLRLHLPGRLDDVPQTPPPPRVRSIGLTLDPQQVVVAVPRGSSAERAGIRPGDVVLRVDATAVSSGADAERALRGPPGSALIALARSGLPYVVRVEREWVSAPE